MIITKNPLKDILLLVSLLERFDVEDAPSQQRLYDAYYGNVGYDDSGKRKKISSVFQDFSELYAESCDFFLRQMHRSKYGLDFGADDLGRLNFDVEILSSLFENTVILPGFSRGLRADFHQGLDELLSSAAYPASLIASFAVATIRELELEIFLEPNEPLYLLPRSIHLGKTFTAVCDGDDDEVRLRLSDIRDFYLILPDGTRM